MTRATADSASGLPLFFSLLFFDCRASCRTAVQRSRLDPGRKKKRGDDADGAGRAGRGGRRTVTGHCSSSLIPHTSPSPCLEFGARGGKVASTEDDRWNRGQPASRPPVRPLIGQRRASSGNSLTASRGRCIYTRDKVRTGCTLAGDPRVAVRWKTALGGLTKYSAATLTSPFVRPLALSMGPLSVQNITTQGEALFDRHRKF